MSIQTGRQAGVRLTATMETLLLPIYKIDEFGQMFVTIRDSSAYRAAKLLQLTATSGAEIGIPTSV